MDEFPQTERTILHVDMDAFFASVEEVDRPELKGRPVVVGGTPQGRGVVAAANYAARAFGIHSAMPAVIARRLCPHAVFLRGRMERYAEVSAAINDIFHRYTPLVQPLSLDEAFLDVSESVRLFGSGEQIGRAIREDIARELGLIASVGVASNKFLAKIASDLDKPNGFVVVDRTNIRAFLDPLPVRRLWGVGKVSARNLERLGIHTIADLLAYPQHQLVQQLGSWGEQLRALAEGVDERPVVSERQAKSVSHETTFAEDVMEQELLESWLAQLAEQVGVRMRRLGCRGNTVQLKVRFADFTTLTRNQHLPAPTDRTREIMQTGLALLRTRLPCPRPPVRLIGIGVSGFGDDDPLQADLFQTQEQRREEQLDAVSDAIRDRFGETLVRRGRSLPHRD